MRSIPFRFHVALARPLLALFLSIAALLAPAADAHEMTPAIADLSFEEDRVEIAIEMNLEAAIAGIGPAHDDTDDAPQAARYERLRASDPAALKEAFAGYRERFLSQLSLRADGEALAPEVGASDTPPVGDVALARESIVTVRAALPPGTETVAFGWAEALGPLILRAPGADPDEPYSAYLTEGELSDSIPVAGAEARGPWAVVADYFVLGYTHILPKGLDHILFVIGLFLLSARLRPLLWQVTSFTLAHTVTLALGITGTVAVSPAIVEPLIAASIVWICVENIFSDRMAAWRPLVVFGFGLLHGLGFAGVLAELGMPDSQFVAALVAFNVGVEVGQLTVIAACFLAVGLWFRDRPWYRSRITIPASILIACIGAYWFVERVGLV